MYRELGNIETKILETIIFMGAKDGVSKVSSKKVAKECDIATGTIFNKFGTMRNALDEAARLFDRKYMTKIINMINEDNSIEDVWDYFMDCLMENKDGSLYYTSYTNTFGFDPTKNNERADEFLETSKAFFKTNNQLDDLQYLLLWDYITTMAFYYSEKFIHYLEYNDENKQLVKKIVFQGLKNII